MYDLNHCYSLLSETFCDHESLGHTFTINYVFKPLLYLYYQINSILREEDPLSSFSAEPVHTFTHISLEQRLPTSFSEKPFLKHDNRPYEPICE